MSGRKARREAGSLSQFYVFSAFSAANQLVEVESGRKERKDRKERGEADVPSQFYVFSAFSAANQLVRVGSGRKDCEEKGASAG